jgi:hypothetical protein
LPGGGVLGFSTQGWSPTRPLHLAPILTSSSLSTHPSLALVARTQGGLTLSPEEGDLDADFCKLGSLPGGAVRVVLRVAINHRKP